MNYNLNETGQKVYVDFNQDISSAGDFGMIIEPKFGEILRADNTSGVSVGAVEIKVGDKTLFADEYLEYTFKDNDLEYAGSWRAKGFAVLNSSRTTITNYARFTVLP